MSIASTLHSIALSLLYLRNLYFFIHGTFHRTHSTNSSVVIVMSLTFSSIQTLGKITLTNKGNIYVEEALCGKKVRLIFSYTLQ